MSRASNSLKAADVTATPIKLKYSSSYSESTICDSGIYAKSGVNGPVTVTGSVPEYTLRYWSIRHLYYSNYLTGSYQVSGSAADNFLQSTAASGTFENNTAVSSSADIRYFPTQSGAKIKIISIPDSAFGQQISNKSFFLASADNTSYKLVDDGNGNIVDALNNNVHVGNIIYAQGFVVITNSDYYCVMDGGPITFPKSYVFDITDLPKTFNPILGAIPDCAPVVSSSLALQEYPYSLFPTYSKSANGNITLSESDPLTKKVGTYKKLYTLSSTYCGVSDEQPITVQIIDVGVKGLSLTLIAPSSTPTASPSKTPTPTPTPTQTPTVTTTPTPTMSTTATPGISSTASASVTPTPSITPTQTPTPTVTPSLTPSPTTPNPDYTTLYVATLKSDACSETTYQYTVPTHLYTGTNTFCDCTSFNGPNVIGIPDGTYWVHEQGTTGARQFTKTGGVGSSQMTAVNGPNGGCTTC